MLLFDSHDREEPRNQGVDGQWRRVAICGFTSSIRLSETYEWAKQLYTRFSALPIYVKPDGAYSGFYGLSLFPKFSYSLQHS